MKIERCVGRILAVIRHDRAAAAQTETSIDGRDDRER